MAQKHMNTSNILHESFRSEELCLLADHRESAHLVDSLLDSACFHNQGPLLQNHATTHIVMGKSLHSPDRFKVVKVISNHHL